MKLRFFLFTLPFILLFAACSGPSSPEFKKMENIRFKSAKLEGNAGVQLTADALFHNPNMLGATLSSIDFDIFANNKKMTHIQQNISTSIPGNADFSLPLTFKIPLKKLIAELKGAKGWDILKNPFEKKEIMIKADGHVKVALAGTDIKIPVTYEMPYTVKVKDLFMR